ncbi:MAG: hypothetical protein KGI58_02035 [Patescibacteria group bacterium]|nr:hypothetical protein [Patescibacteria group bacterium]
MKIISIIIIVAGILFIIRSVKFVRVILTIVIGIVYIPLNKFNTKVQKWYFKMKTEDIVIYRAFTPFYWTLVAITFIVSVPYEFVIANDIH